MKIVTPPDFGKTLIQSLKSSQDVLVAVAYCSETDGFEEAISHVVSGPGGRVRIIVSSEWQRSDPTFLKRMHAPPRVEVRQIEHTRVGRLHAKAFVGLGKSGAPTFALVGSANVSDPAFRTNREMAVLFSEAEDAAAILDIRRNIEAWFKNATDIDWNEAVRIWKSRPKSGIGPNGDPIDRPLIMTKTARRSPRLWIMKMWNHEQGMKPWETAKVEGDLILGWGVGEGAELDRVLAGRKPIRSRAYWAKHRGGLATIRRFWKDMCVGDRVLVVNGWSAKNQGNAQIHGWAIVRGHARLCVPPPWVRDGNGWRYRRAAAIRSLHEMEKPLSLLREIVDLDSCLNTLHETKSSFREVAKKIGISRP